MAATSNLAWGKTEASAIAPPPMDWPESPGNCRNVNMTRVYDEIIDFIAGG
jgi:hypothetical protein